MTRPIGRREFAKVSAAVSASVGGPPADRPARAAAGGPRKSEAGGRARPGRTG